MARNGLIIITAIGSLFYLTPLNSILKIFGLVLTVYDYQYADPIPDQDLIEILDANRVEWERELIRFNEGTAFAYDIHEKAYSDASGTPNATIPDQLRSLIKIISSPAFTAFGASMGADQRWWFETAPSRRYHANYLVQKTLFWVPSAAHSSQKSVCSSAGSVYICSDTSENLPANPDTENGQSVTRYIGSGWYISLSYLSEEIPG